jgi:hypothetical protein
MRITRLSSVGTVLAAFVLACGGGGGGNDGGGGPAAGSVLIAAGSEVAVGDFQADAYFDGGSTTTYAGAIDLSLITEDPPPAALFGSERYGEVTYTIPGLTASGAYAVTLYFVESWVQGAGERVFSVDINGTQVLTDFDISAEVAAAKGLDPNPGDTSLQGYAIAKSSSVTADGDGQVVIHFIPNVENPKVCGIKVVPVTAP